MSVPATRYAFAEAAREYESLLTAIARRLCGNEADAEDLVHDTYERALRAWDRSADHPDLRSWIVAILNHLFIDRCRKARRAPTTLSVDCLELAAPAPAVPPTWSGVSDHDVSAALATIDLDLRRTYELRAHGRSYEQIAAELHIPRATVGTRLFRARHKLRTALLRQRRYDQ